VISTKCDVGRSGSLIDYFLYRQIGLCRDVLPR
jgi:hypothetical protein